MTVEALLNRCDKVRETGPGEYMACCPAHDDKSPSLAIKDCEDGRVLIHCFAGCGYDAVLDAVGLKVADIMPNLVSKSSLTGLRKWISPRVALSTLDHEALVVGIIGADFLENRSIDDDTWSRLATAVERINSTRARFAPQKLTW